VELTATFLQFPVIPVKAGTRNVRYGKIDVLSIFSV
jgi:hypothetical protein